MGEYLSNPQPLLDQFLASLQELPDVHAAVTTLEAVKATERADAEITLSVGGKSIFLIVEAKKRVYPRDAQQTIWHLRAINRGPRAEGLPVIVAESLSPGAKELLRTERIGYFDSGGSLFLPAAGAYVYIDKPAPKSWERAVRSLFSGRRAQALQVLLENAREWFGVKELAQRAHVAASTASEVFSELERLDRVAVQGQGPSKERQLREPEKLLDAWVKQLETDRPSKSRRYFVPGLKTDALLSRLAEVFASHGIEYAVTHEAAAQRYAPYLSVVSQVRARVAPRSNLVDAFKKLGALEVDGGANLVIIEAKSPGELQFRHQDAGVWFATVIQVYLDLMRSEGRARDMAAHLREAMIQF
jgi:hypothetical protein